MSSDQAITSPRKKRSYQVAKESITTETELKSNGTTLSPEGFARPQKSHKQPGMKKLVAPIQPATEILKYCTLFSNANSDDDMRIKHHPEIVLDVPKRSVQWEPPHEPSAQIERKRSATATMIFFNQLDTTLISKASNSFHVQQVNANIIDSKPNPNSLRRHKSLSSLSSEPRRQPEVKTQSVVDDFDSNELDPFHEDPEGWLIVSASEDSHYIQEQLKREHYQQPDLDRSFQQIQDCNPINRQGTTQKRRQKVRAKSEYFDQVQAWNPRVQDKHQLLPLYKSEEEQALRSQKVINPVDSSIEGKVIWKTCRAAQTRRRLRRRLRLSGWELSALLKNLERPAALQVAGQSCS